MVVSELVRFFRSHAIKVLIVLSSVPLLVVVMNKPEKKGRESEHAYIGCEIQEIADTVCQ
jgi:hypothetical protein